MEKGKTKLNDELYTRYIKKKKKTTNNNNQTNYYDVGNVINFEHSSENEMEKTNAYLRNSYTNETLFYHNYLGKTM